MEFIDEKPVFVDEEIIQHLIDLINHFSEFPSIGVYVIVEKKGEGVLLSKAFGTQGQKLIHACENKRIKGGGTECQNITVCCMGFGYYPSHIGNYCLEYLLSLFIAFFEKEKSMKRILRKVAYTGNRKGKDLLKKIAEEFFLWTDGQFDHRKWKA